MTKVIKTTFEEEQKMKDEAFLRLTPFQRWEHALRVRKKMRKPGVDYSFEGKKIKVTRG
jgi:hypothetical protein